MSRKIIHKCVLPFGTHMTRLNTCELSITSIHFNRKGNNKLNYQLGLEVKCQRMNSEVALALGHLLGESHQVVVVVHKMTAIDLRAEGADAIPALRAYRCGREQFMIRQRQSNAIRSGCPRHAGPHGIDKGAHLRQALHFTLTLHHRVAVLGEHQLHGHLETRHRQFNALGSRLKGGMHVLRKLHLGLGIVDAVVVQEFTKNVTRIEEWISGLSHARIHGLLKKIFVFKYHYTSIKWTRNLPPRAAIR